jgi:pimeloyl-ACP methyl ester carboxylesterase
MRRALFACLLLVLVIRYEGQPSSAPLSVNQGCVATPDGVKLFYQKVGSGRETVILPARLFLFRDFQRLANGRALTFYDMRDRGRSDAVADPKRITIQTDVDDLETIRKHFAIDKPDLIGFSYLGMTVMLYAVEHPDHVRRIVQLGPVPRKFDTKYQPALTAQDTNAVPDPAALKRLEALETNGLYS